MCLRSKYLSSVFIFPLPRHSQDPEARSVRWFVLRAAKKRNSTARAQRDMRALRFAESDSQRSLARVQREDTVARRRVEWFLPFISPCFLFREACEPTRQAPFHSRAGCAPQTVKTEFPVWSLFAGRVLHTLVAWPTETCFAARKGKIN